MCVWGLGDGGGRIARARIFRVVVSGIWRKIKCVKMCCISVGGKFSVGELKIKNAVVR